MVARVHHFIDADAQPEQIKSISNILYSRNKIDVYFIPSYKIFFNTHCREELRIKFIDGTSTRRFKNNSHRRVAQDLCHQAFYHVDALPYHAVFWHPPSYLRDCQCQGAYSFSWRWNPTKNRASLSQNVHSMEFDDIRRHKRWTCAKHLPKSSPTYDF